MEGKNDVLVASRRLNSRQIQASLRDAADCGIAFPALKSRAKLNCRAAAKKLAARLNVMSKNRKWEQMAMTGGLRYRILASPLAVPTAIEFLESDPWFHSSGYIKANLIKFINRQELKPEWSKRLQKVVLAAVDRQDRREFRSYCRLARKINSEKLRSELLCRLEDENNGVRRRARWMLEYLVHKKT